ncbi:head-tail adaptor protein [Phenylobacterium sp.]|uniref:head-tail adaptor protein n=1 Tax=Phenylobacterium sp. TaxID=1871053 RepID=UPI00391B21E8
MSAAGFDRLLIVHRATETRDAMNDEVETWAELTRVMARRLPVSDGERIRAQQAGAFVTDRFQVWWLPVLRAVSPKGYQLECEGRRYDITGVNELGFREKLEFTANARADAPTDPGTS